MNLTELIAPDSFNTRNIPRAPFYESISNFVNTSGDISHAILELENRLAQYNIMFNSLTEQRNSLAKSIPSLNQTQVSLDFIETQGDNVLFCHELVNGLYAKAKITDNKKVGIFLGSNIMVEYTVEEAKQLIQKNIDQINGQIKDLNNNLEFLKEQITVIEVTVSRVFNYDVQLRKKVSEK